MSSAIEALVDQLADAVARRLLDLQKIEAEKSRTVYLTPVEMAERMNVVPKTLANLRSAKKGPKFTRIGGRIRYPVDSQS